MPELGFEVCAVTHALRDNGQLTLDGDGNVVEQREPTVVRQVVSSETSSRVCEILEFSIARQL